MSSSFTYEVQPASLDDLPNLVDVFFDAFNGDHYQKYFPNTPECRGWISSSHERFIKKEAPKHDSQVSVVRDETGKVVGWMIWWVVKPEDKGLESFFVRWPDVAPTMSRENLEEFFAPPTLRNRRLMGDKAHVFVEVLAVSEEHRGKGLGAKLVQEATRTADELEYPAYLDAAPKAISLYARAGFLPHPGEGRSTSMVRPSRAETAAAGYK